MILRNEITLCYIAKNFTLFLINKIILDSAIHIFVNQFVRIFNLNLAHKEIREPRLLGKTWQVNAMVLLIHSQ